MLTEVKPCRGCGAKVLFAKDSKGDVQPLDVSAPVFELTRDLSGTLIATRAEAVYVSHFKTCPKANDFSASKKREKVT